MLHRTSRLPGEAGHGGSTAGPGQLRSCSQVWLWARRAPAAPPAPGGSGLGALRLGSALPPLPSLLCPTRLLAGLEMCAVAIRAGSLAERSSCLWPKARSRCQAPAGLGVSLCPEWGEEQHRWGILSWSGGTLGETEQLSCVLLAVTSQTGRERCLADLLQPVRHAAGRDLALL